MNYLYKTIISFLSSESKVHLKPLLKYISYLKTFNDTNIMTMAKHRIIIYYRKSLNVTTLECFAYIVLNELVQICHNIRSIIVVLN